MNQIEPDGTVLSLGFVKMALFRCRVVKVIRRNKIIFRIMISTLVSTVITPTVPPDYLTIISYLTRIQFHSCWRLENIISITVLFVKTLFEKDLIWPLLSYSIWIDILLASMSARPSWLPEAFIMVLKWCFRLFSLSDNQWTHLTFQDRSWLSLFIGERPHWTSNDQNLENIIKRLSIFPFD